MAVRPEEEVAARANVNNDEGAEKASSSPAESRKTGVDVEDGHTEQGDNQNNSNGLEEPQDVETPPNQAHSATYKPLTKYQIFLLALSFTDVLVIPLVDFVTNLVFLIYLCEVDVLRCIDFVQKNDYTAKAVFAAKLSGDAMIGLTCFATFLYFIDASMMASRLLTFFKGRIKQGLPVEMGPLPTHMWLKEKHKGTTRARILGLCQTLMAFVEVEDHAQRNVYRFTLPRVQNIVAATIADTIQVVVDVSYLYYTGSGSGIALFSLLVALVSLIDAWSLELGWLCWTTSSYFWRWLQKWRGKIEKRKVRFWPVKGHMPFPYWPFRLFWALAFILGVLLVVFLDSISPGLIYGADVTYLTKVEAKLRVTCRPEVGGLLGQAVSYDLQFGGTINDTALGFEKKMHWNGFFFYSSVTADSDLFGGDDPDLSAVLTTASGRLRQSYNFTAPFASYNFTTQCKSPNDTHCVDPHLLRDQCPLYMFFVPSLSGISLGIVPPSLNWSLSFSQRGEPGKAPKPTLDPVYLDLGYDVSGSWSSQTFYPKKQPTWRVLCPPPDLQSVLLTKAGRGGRTDALQTLYEGYLNNTQYAPLGVLESVAVNRSMEGKFCDGY